MAKRYRLSHQAIQDLVGIADFLTSNNAPAAERVLSKLHESMQMLAANPDVGLARNDMYPGLPVYVPSRPADRYVPFYYVLPNVIEISDVIHSARDWIEMFSRGER